MGRGTVPRVLQFTANDAGERVTGAAVAPPDVEGELPILFAYGFVVIAALTLVGIAIILILWRSGNLVRSSKATTDPGAASILAVIFVSQQNVERWIPATVMRLAVSGVLKIVDDVVTGQKTRRILLEFTGDPADVKTRTRHGDPDAGVAWALFGGSPEPGMRVPARRTRPVTDLLAQVAHVGIARIRRDYMEKPPRVWLAVFLVGSLIGLVGGLVVAGIGPQTTEGFVLAGIAMVLGIIGLGWMAIGIPYMGSFNVAGLRLRDRSSRQLLLPASNTLAEGELSLQWAVLHGRHDRIRLVASALGRGGSAPPWYCTDGDFSPARLSRCIEEVSDALTIDTPVPDRVGDEVSVYREWTTDGRLIFRDDGEGNRRY